MQNHRSFKGYLLIGLQYLINSGLVDSPLVYWNQNVSSHSIGLKIPRWQHRTGSSPVTSIALNRNPQFQLCAEVDSFSLPEIPIIALAEEIFLLISRTAAMD